MQSASPDQLTAGGSTRKRRAAAKKAEKKFQALSKSLRFASDESDLSDIFSDDSEDNFDLSQEIASRKMYKIEVNRSGIRFVIFSSLKEQTSC